LPPFGRLFAGWVAASGVDPGLIQPGVTELIDNTAYESMRAFRAPFVKIHEFTFYLIAIAVVLHLVAVVVTEIHEGGSITSAMFTGRKILTRKPPDAP
jgi:Ni/Fe-hydrogenase 1 B-type cytochrome subunit